MTTYNGQSAVRDRHCALLYDWNVGLASTCVWVSAARKPLLECSRSIRIVLAQRSKRAMDCRTKQQQLPHQQPTAAVEHHRMVAIEVLARSLRSHSCMAASGASHAEVLSIWSLDLTFAICTRCPRSSHSTLLIDLLGIHCQCGHLYCLCVSARTHPAT